MVELKWERAVVSGKPVSFPELPAKPVVCTDNNFILWRYSRLGEGAHVGYAGPYDPNQVWKEGIVIGDLLLCSITDFSLNYFETEIFPQFDHFVKAERGEYIHYLVEYPPRTGRKILFSFAAKSPGSLFLIEVHAVKQDENVCFRKRGDFAGVVPAGSEILLEDK